MFERSHEITKEVVLDEIGSLDFGRAIGSYVPLIQRIDRPQETLLVYREHLWRIALHWFIKLKFDPKHKIPGQKKHRELMKPHGELLKAQYDLCVQIHPFLGEKPPYANAGLWFFAICAESQLHAISSIIEPQQKPEGFSGKNKKVLLADSPKEAGLSQQKTVAQMLAAKENPWPNWRDSKWANALGLLIETSIKVCEAAPAIEQQYWKPFQKAYSAWIRDLDRNPGWGQTRTQGGELLVSTGQGRGVRKVPQLSFSISEKLTA